MGELFRVSHALLEVENRLVGGQKKGKKFRILKLTYHVYLVLLLQSYLILLLHYLDQVRVNLLCFLRQLHVAVMNENKVFVLVTRGRRHLQNKEEHSS